MYRALLNNLMYVHWQLFATIKVCIYSHKPQHKAGNEEGEKKIIHGREVTPYISNNGV